MSKQPRKHHYVPQFYLAGFTDNGIASGTLYVLDKSKQTQWSSTPKDSAHQRDFHAVDLGPNIDPMGVEKRLAIFEGQQSVVLKRILDDEALPGSGDEAIGPLINLVALLAVRVPRIRQTVSDFIDQAEKMALRALFATKKGRDQFRQFVEQNKATLDPMQRAEVERLLRKDSDLDEMAEFVGSGRYTVSYDQTWEVQMMLRMTITLMPWLSLRNWSLWVAAEGTPDVICSDSPVGLAWTKKTSGSWPPGFGVPGTIVSVPLSKRIGLVGMFEPLPRKLIIGRDEVAAMNSATLMYADQVFSPQPDFVWRTANGCLGGKADLRTGLQEPATSV
jgi:hypothetical protein